MLRKKIAIFSGFYLPFLGGIERYTDKLSAELTAQGFDVVIITTNHDNLPSIEVVGARKIYRLPSARFFKQRYPIIVKNGEYHTLMKGIEQEEIDYYLCNTRFQLTTMLGAKMAGRAGKRAIVIDHGSSHFTVGNPVLDYFGKIYEHLLTLRVKSLVKRFYGVSERCNQWLRHFNISAAGVFYNAVDADTREVNSDNVYLPNGAESYNTVISYAGRIMKEKGVGVLLESFLRAAAHRRDVCLVIAGDGPYYEEARRAYVQDNIFFTGKLDYSQVMGLFSRTDIFCYPSQYPEGLPTSILEAGIMGCAVVATDRGGTKEVITSSDYGIIVDETEDSLTLALEELLDNNARVDQLKANLRTRVKQAFTWGATAERVGIELMQEEKI